MRNVRTAISKCNKRHDGLPKVKLDKDINRHKEKKEKEKKKTAKMKKRIPCV